MGKVITIAQQKGGSGKTTLAANLGVALLARDVSVAMVDTDPQGSLGQWYIERMERDPAPQRMPEFSTSSAWGVGIEGRKYAKSHDYLIVDTPPKIDADLRPALRVADLVLVPVASSHVDLWATEGVLDLAAREGVEALVVLNRAKAGTKLAAEVAEAARGFGVAVWDGVLGNRVAYAEALGKGLGVMEVASAKAAQAEITALVEAVS